MKNKYGMQLYHELGLMLHYQVIDNKEYDDLLKEVGEYFEEGEENAKINKIYKIFKVAIIFLAFIACATILETANYEVIEKFDASNRMEANASIDFKNTRSQDYIFDSNIINMYNEIGNEYKNLVDICKDEENGKNRKAELERSEKYFSEKIKKIDISKESDQYRYTISISFMAENAKKASEYLLKYNKTRDENFLSEAKICLNNYDKLREVFIRNRIELLAKAGYPDYYIQKMDFNIH